MNTRAKYLTKYVDTKHNVPIFDTSTHRILHRPMSLLPKHPHTQDAVAKMLEAAELTTTEAADKIGVRPQTVGKYTTGTHDRGLDSLARWATRLGLRQRVYYEKIDPPTS